MGLFKRKRKNNTGDDKGSGSEFANVESGEEDTNDLLARLQSGYDDVQRDRQREAQMRERAKSRRKSPCGCF